MFGYSLMPAGLGQIIDICLITTSSLTASLDDYEGEHTVTSRFNVNEDGD